VIRGAVAAGLLLFAGVGFVYWRAMTPLVVAVHPELGVVPSNLLRLYVDFSQPMAGDDAFEHVRLLDASGKPIPNAFREIELWSHDNRRLMAYVHPGRVKSGLAIGDQFGPVLEEGKTYTLEVLPGMKSRSGRPLEGRFARRLTAGPPDQRPPDLARWTLLPHPDRLEVVCDEWLDHAGLEDFGGRPPGGPGREQLHQAVRDPERIHAAAVGAPGGARPLLPGAFARIDSRLPNVSSEYLLSRENDS